jgi:hypothetical protein
MYSSTKTLLTKVRKRNQRRELTNVALNIKAVTMDISIEGLTIRQRVIADVLWSMDTPEEVSSFIDSLSGDTQREARVVMTMMTWAMLDTVNDTNLAVPILEKYRL